MADDNVKYQHKTVQAIRGTEARSISKPESVDGPGVSAAGTAR